MFWEKKLSESAESSFGIDQFHVRGLCKNDNKFIGGIGNSSWLRLQLLGSSRFRLWRQNFFDFTALSFEIKCSSQIPGWMSDVTLEISLDLSIWPKNFKFNIFDGHQYRHKLIAMAWIRVWRKVLRYFPWNMRFHPHGVRKKTFAKKWLFKKNS